jgi:hypothetical protein
VVQVINTGQHVLFGIASQSLYYDVPEGRASSITSCSIREDSDDEDVTAESATDGSPSNDSVNTTFSSASGDGQIDPTRLNLTSLASLAKGRQYLATNALYGQSEWLEIAGVGATYALAVSPLAHPYAAADTFVGTRITQALATDWVSDTDNLSDPLCPRPRWRMTVEYVCASKTYRKVVLFDLYRFGPFETTVNGADVDRGSRGFLQRLPIDSRGGNGELLIKDAVQQVKLDLWERGLTAVAQRSSEWINELVRLKAVALVSKMAVQMGGSRTDVAESDEAAYWARVDNLAAKVSQQVSPDGAAGTVTRTPLWRR